LLFNGTLVSFDQENGAQPGIGRWRPKSILENQPGEAVGADVFTFTMAMHAKTGPLGMYATGSRSLWDVDMPNGDQYLFEHGSDFLIKRRDRIHNILGQVSLDLPGYRWMRPFTYQGVFLRNQYYATVQTKLDKNLLSLGLGGFRYGSNSVSQKRGLDVAVGYWTHHEQLKSEPVYRRMHISLDWKWTVDFLSDYKVDLH
jgi:hypothetical protein